MNPEELYKNLKETAEKLGITVSEQNFRKAGIKVESGMCKIKGKPLFIIDKHIPIQKKSELLASCLSRMSLEDVYIVPAIREIIKTGMFLETT